MMVVGVKVVVKEGEEGCQTERTGDWTVLNWGEQVLGSNAASFEHHLETTGSEVMVVGGQHESRTYCQPMEEGTLVASYSYGVCKLQYIF